MIFTWVSGSWQLLLYIQCALNTMAITAAIFLVLNMCATTLGVSHAELR